jgi:hypothetical protein
MLNETLSKISVLSQIPNADEIGSENPIPEQLHKLVLIGINCGPM